MAKNDSTKSFNAGVRAERIAWMKRIARLQREGNRLTREKVLELLKQFGSVGEEGVR